MIFTAHRYLIEKSQRGSILLLFASFARIIAAVFLSQFFQEVISLSGAASLSTLYSFHQIFFRIVRFALFSSLLR